MCQFPLLLDSLKSPFVYLHVLASLAVLVFESCEKKYDNLVDPLGQAPLLVAASVSPTTVNTDTINIGPERKPDDLLPIELNVFSKVISERGQFALPMVFATVFSQYHDSSLGSAILHDNGMIPDTAVGDSVYSASIQIQLPRAEIGILSVEIYAESESGYRSNIHVLPLTIVRLNQPPVLSNLIAPDTVRTSLQNSFLITVMASDADGLADIRSVVRTTPSGLVLQLNDNGTNGDAVAGDGVFSEVVSLSPPPPPGSYTFTFQAFDRSNEGSNTIAHTIVVMP
ncbi:MAG: hypothetical protein HYW57_06630 [Ignavibacteriales bacterium]|nr:hypothetical protein [Ignavibacteriales bacterium]